jgi:alanine racemase
MSLMPRPIRLLIHIDAMRHNLATIRQRVGRSRIWAVAKANAYGQGIDQAVAGFEQADGLAVLDLHEARLARDRGWSKPILLIEGAFGAQDLAEIRRLDAQTVIATPEQAAVFLKADQVPTQVWIKLNTGMNRLGFNPATDQNAMLDQLKAIEARIDQPLHWMTHFANADNLSSTVGVSWQEQGQRFTHWTKTLLSHLRSGGCYSLANSAASLLHPDSHADWVRPGIALYGATPLSDAMASHTARGLGLRPVQSLHAEVIALQDVKRGEAVGYGSRFVAADDMRIAVLACGYADGYPRSATDGTPVWVEGELATLVGRVSMDMVTIDVTNQPTVRVGSEAQLWGSHVAIDEVANRAGTIGYELMSKITNRVPRVINDGER